MCAGFLVFYEYAVLIHITDFCREGRQFRLREVMKGSVWNFSSMKGWSMVPASVVFVLVIPFTHFAWKSTMVPSVDVPWFIEGEMIRSLIGVIGVLGIYAACLIGFLLTMFVPIYMVQKKQTIGKAFVSNLRLLRKLAWKWKLAFGVFLAAYYTLSPYLSWIVSRKRLTYKDFDSDFRPPWSKGVEKPLRENEENPVSGGSGGSCRWFCLLYSRGSDGSDSGRSSALGHRPQRLY